MEINAQDVIDRLSQKLAKSESEKTVMEVQIEALQNHIADLSAKIPQSQEGPIEGELIGS